MRRIAALVTSALLIVAAAPARAAVPAYQADVVSGTRGDGVYGRDPAQTGEIVVSPGFGIFFEFTVQNDGTQTDTMRLRLRSQGDPDIAATVTVGTEDATGQFSPGPYRVHRLAPDGEFTFGLGFVPGPSATPGDVRTYRLVAISAGDPTARDIWVVAVTVLDPG